MDNDIMITLMDAVLYAKEGENPSKAIENQKRRGQQSVVINLRLPKKANDHSVPQKVRWNGIEESMGWEERKRIVTQNNIAYTRQQYEKMGIVIAEEYDDLFWNVVLPDGWKMEATDHSTWSNLLDNKGRKRANFFYKAAFYDRDAFINFDTRYHASVEHVADAGSDYKAWKNSDYQGTVKDGDKIIFSTACVAVTGSHNGDDKLIDSLQKELDRYMEENYPDYENIHAYWD